MGLSNSIALLYAIISVPGFDKMEIVVVCATTAHARVQRHDMFSC